MWECVIYICDVVVCGSVFEVKEGKSICMHKVSVSC